MTPHEELLDDVAVYALGAMPPEQSAIVRKHIEECAECSEEYRRLRPAADAVAYSAEACPDADRGAVVVSPLLKQRIMRSVRGDLAPKPIASPAPQLDRS
ncbi:MAG: zf-HC2 domain-containing protein, partial [Candidatus Eremiobacteraeota bacterium]|nr:zf-HC2 domain-containing protein [Candidatus Eremiobacteraeota bacterium]